MLGSYRTVRMLVVLFAIVSVSAHSQDRPEGSLTVREVASPAAPESGEPNLFAANDGRVFLSWIEKTDKGHALRFAVRNRDNWSEPRAIAEGANWFVNWADFPSLIVLPDGTMVAHWLEKSGTGTYAYNVNISRSTDGGKTWSKPLVPHRDGTQTEHGFVSLMAWRDGSAGAVWLDGRNFASKEHDAGGHGSSSAEMTLRFAAIDSKGRLSEEALLDGRACECCQTSAALTSEGAVVVYRDRSEKEVRDISIVRYHKGIWTAPETIHADDWEINGCPVNGPSVAADGRKVAVAWFTGAGDKPRVNVVFSNDAGATFGQPVQVDDGSPMGRVQVIMLAEGSALVVWLERTTKGGEFRARRIKPDGARDHAIIVGESSSTRAGGFPRMARAGNEVIFAWTDPGKPSMVKTAVGKLPGYK